MSEIYSGSKNSVPHNDQAFLAYGCSTSTNSVQIKLLLSKKSVNNRQELCQRTEKTWIDEEGTNFVTECNEKVQRHIYR